jgi:hypothetical protein
MLPMYSAILSLGKSTILLKMTFILLCLEWGLGIPFVINFGFTGIALNQPIIAALFLIIYRTVLKSEDITLKIFDTIKWQFALAIVTGIIVKISAQHVHLNIVTLSTLFLSGCLIFAGLIYAMQRDTALEFKNYALSIVGKGEH